MAVATRGPLAHLSTCRKGLRENRVSGSCNSGGFHSLGLTPQSSFQQLGRKGSN